MLDDGAAFVALGRSAIGNPDWPRQVARADWAAVPPPWSAEHLRSVDVGAALLTYLESFDGLLA